MARTTADGSVPPVVAAAAVALDLPPSALRPTEGRSGLTWQVGPDILRLVPLTRVGCELAARSAAAAVVPVPEVLARTDLQGHAALLEQRLPGTPGTRADGAGLDPPRARRRGEACGRVHAAVTAVAGPPQVPAAEAAPVPGRALLHLDLHPLNVLVDEEDRVSGVIDWANAAAGDPSLDRARTRALFAAHPLMRRLRASRSGRAFLTGWSEAAELDSVPAVSRAWGLRYFIADQAGLPGEPGVGTARRLLAGLT